jgi:hypothetical protein
VIESQVRDSARNATLLVRARALAAFVGAGRPVTAKAVLRRAEIGPACTAVGLPDPGRVVSAADVPALHRAWVAAQGAGLITVGLRAATATTTSADPVEQWRAAVLALLRAASGDPTHRSATVVSCAALDALAAHPGIGDPGFSDAVEAELMRRPLDERYMIGHAFRRGVFIEAGALELLGECGAVDTATRTLTPLGRWARPVLDQPLPVPAAWADTDALELRIDLDRFRPPVWRRLRVPAATTLAELHHIIQTVFEWDDDHLHVFTIDRMSYADPWHELDGCADESGLTLAAALPRPGARLTYRYDLGDCWDHTVLLENGGPSTEPDRPTLLGGRGDAPVEDWIPPDPDGPDDEPQPQALPFDLAALDRRLAEQGHRR